MPAPRCPNCLNGETIYSDFNEAHCKSCGLYWHYWMDEPFIQGQVLEHRNKLKKTGLKKRGDS